jgi:AraC-like DNA-binding protein
MRELTCSSPPKGLSHQRSTAARLTPQAPSHPCEISSGHAGSKRRLPPSGSSPKLAIQNLGLPPARLKFVLEFIDEHLDRNITLNELARNAKLSVFHFANLFKKSTGLSPHRFMLHRRVARAGELLRSTSLSVLEVSLDLGFQHQNNFARAFRRVTGMTPSHFRRVQGSENAWVRKSRAADCGSCNVSLHDITQRQAVPCGSTVHIRS